jgi:hypothetical protein
MSLEMAKSLLATVVLVLALAQATSMAQIRGYLKFKLIPLPARSLRNWHRWGGDATLLLTLTVALICLTGEPYASYHWRVPLHAALGALAALVMFLKVFIARRFRHYLRYHTLLGPTAGLAVLGTFIASALWYFLSL